MVDEVYRHYVITSRLSQQDWRTMALILFLTTISLVGLTLATLVTSYSLRPQDVVMIVAWFFGATMTLAWVKREEWFGDWLRRRRQRRLNPRNLTVRNPQHEAPDPS